MPTPQGRLRAFYRDAAGALARAAAVRRQSEEYVRLSKQRVEDLAAMLARTEEAVALSRLALRCGPAGVKTEVGLDRASSAL
jgi:hypothetical protein